jgi:predicted DNA-binding transcriptional regulator YafY
MSYKFDSLISILNKLDKKEKVTIHSLMNDLEVSERTTHRYLQTLQVAGFPISYDRKKESYGFIEGYSLTRPDLSVEETLSFALAKTMLSGLGAGMEKGLNSLEEKLSIKNLPLPKHVVLKADEPSKAVKGFFEPIHEAITNFQRLELVYQTLYTDTTSERKVDPLYLFYRDGFWMLRAYCNRRKGLRTFALDRIVFLRILNEHFPPREVSPDDELPGAFGSRVDGKPCKVILRFDKESRPYILRKKWHQSQKHKELKDGRIELTFRVHGLDDIKHWIYKWLPHVEVATPKELKEIVRADLKKSLKHI